MSPSDRDDIKNHLHLAWRGDPEGDWDLYSFKLYKRLAADMPEFDQVAAFQAEAGVLSVGYGKDRAQARALMGEYVSGNSSRPSE